MYSYFLKRNFDFVVVLLICTGAIFAFDGGWLQVAWAYVAGGMLGVVIYMARARLAEDRVRYIMAAAQQAGATSIVVDPSTGETAMAIPKKDEETPPTIH